MPTSLRDTGEGRINFHVVVLQTLVLRGELMMLVEHTRPPHVLHID